MPFGSGMELSEEKNIDGQTINWDLTIDTTGDIGSVNGVDELAKDLAFNTAVELDDFIGAPVSETYKGRLRVKVQNILLDDERVNAVPRISVLAEGDTVEIDVTITADSGETYDFVIPVSR